MPSRPAKLMVRLAFLDTTGFARKATGMLEMPVVPP